jgi:hypothetical protein
MEIHYPWGGVDMTKAFKSTISEIAENTFNTGQNKFAAQFTQSHKSASNYLQRTLACKGYLVTKTVRTGKKQIIELPPAVDESAADAEDQKIIRAEEVKTVVKRQLKLGEALKKWYATVYDQCFQEVRDKLELTDNWDKTQKEQSLKELIRKIKRICVGFNDHKQEAFNLVQAMKTLYLYTQWEKESIEEYGRNFKSLWDTVEAFGGSPGMHKGLIEGIHKDPGRVKNVNSITDMECWGAEQEVSDTGKAALVISGADKWQYRKLKDELANNYLLWTDQCPDTFDKAVRILGNNQTSRVNMPYRANPNDTGVAFLQSGSQGSAQAKGAEDMAEVVPVEAMEATRLGQMPVEVRATPQA